MRKGQATLTDPPAAILDDFISIWTSIDFISVHHLSTLVRVRGFHISTAVQGTLLKKPPPTTGPRITTEPGLALLLVV
jgi:hypothetical protein